VDSDGNPQVPEVWLWNNDVAFLFTRSGRLTDDAPVDVEERETREIPGAGRSAPAGYLSIYRYVTCHDDASDLCRWVGFRPTRIRVLFV
jgi:hypothetical protein